jgi:hypothetical protein
VFTVYNFRSIKILSVLYIGIRDIVQLSDKLLGEEVRTQLAEMFDLHLTKAVWCVNQKKREILHMLGF